MTDDVRLDLSRGERIGIDEAVLAGPKSDAQLARVLDEAAVGNRSMLLTRLSPDQLAALPIAHGAKIDYDEESETGFYGAPSILTGESDIAVVCAGTSDRRVAGEIERTLEFAGIASLSVSDVGVAGLWRLTERLEELSAMKVIVVVAGMEGALPTVVAGLVPSVVIAVPTSVGYGVASEGHVALHSALASCAPGVVVVNIDNGYGAACAAMRVLAAISR
jgi:NCAIR mutase (PurE)-related protein